jgi:hypothetical protein
MPSTGYRLCTRQILKEIRGIRNDSIGHPTKRGGGKGLAYNFIGRASLKKEGFDLITTYPDDKRPLFRYVSIKSLIKKQRDVMRRGLTEVLGRLKKDEADHRVKYRDQKIEDVFPATLGYYFDKIGNAIDGSHPKDLGTLHIRLVSEVIEAFEECLKERGALQAYGSVVDLIELIEYPIQELTKYFIGGSTLSKNGAHIFSFFVYKHIEELKSVAKEIDEDYQSEP